MSDDAPTRTLTPRWAHDTQDVSDSTIPSPGPEQRPSAELLSNARYRVGDEIGRGGMGRVVAATDLALERQVAIKQVLVDDPEHIARFEREARITAKLAHPAVVPVFDVGVDPNGRPFYVMRKIEGTPLDDKIASAVTARDRLGQLPAVLSAIDAAASAHAQDIVHRDIKPANILLGPYGETLLIDWGLARDGGTDVPSGKRPIAARDADEGLTRAGHAYGTIGYMAPEQARGERADARADVYALGATLYHVATGKLPSGRLGATAWLARMIDDPQPLVITDEEVPAELSAIVKKATMPERDARYANAGELASDLRRFLAGQLVAAHRYTTRQRLARFVKRHLVAVAAVSAATALVVAIGIIAVVNVFHARDDAEAAQAVAEREAEDAALRNDQLLLDQAQRFVETQPERALAVIERIRVGSPEWRAARDVLAEAVLQGIPHGLTALHGLVLPHGFGPDGARVLLTSSTGEVAVLDLPRREVTVLRPEGDNDVFDAVWCGAVVLTSTREGVAAYDPVTAKKRVVAADVKLTPLYATADPQHVRYRDLATSELRDLAVDTGKSTLVATEVYDVKTDGSAAIVMTARQFQLVPSLELAPLSIDRQPDHRVASIAVSATSRRAAAAFTDVIVEWNLDTGDELRRVPVPSNSLAAFLYYSRGTLMMDLRTNTRREVHTVGVPEGFVVAGTWNAGWQGDTARGAIFSSDGGDIAIYRTGATVAHLSPRPGIQGLATDPRSSVIVTGSSDGTVYWWDVAAVLPKDFDTKQNDVWPCFMDGTRMIATSSGGQIRSFDLTTGEGKLLHDEGEVIGCWRGKPMGGRLAFRTFMWNLYDLASDRTLHINSPLIVPDFANDAWLDIRGESVLQIKAGDTTGQPWWKLPFHIHAFSKRDDVAIAGLGDGRIVRRDGAGNERTATLGTKPIGAVSVAESGVAWAAEGRDIYRWPPGDPAPTKFVTLGHDAVDLIGGPDGSLVAKLDDYTLWIVRPGKAAARLPGNADNSYWTATTEEVLEQTATSIRRIHLATGQASLQHLDSKQGSLMLLEPRGILVTTETIPAHVMVFSDTVPDDQTSALEWIHEQTNFSIDPKTEEAAWR